MIAELTRDGDTADKDLRAKLIDDALAALETSETPADRQADRVLVALGDAWLAAWHRCAAQNRGRTAPDNREEEDRVNRVMEIFDAVVVTVATTPAGARVKFKVLADSENDGSKVAPELEAGLLGGALAALGKNRAHVWTDSTRFEG